MRIPDETGEAASGWPGVRFEKRPRRIAADGRQLVADLPDVRADSERIASARVGSAGRRLLDVLQRQPIIDAKLASDALGISARNAQGGIDRLVEDGILHKIGSAERNRAYEAREVLIASDEFAARAKRERQG